MVNKVFSFLMFANQDYLFIDVLLIHKNVVMVDWRITRFCAKRRVWVG